MPSKSSQSSATFSRTRAVPPARLRFASHTRCCGLKWSILRLVASLTGQSSTDFSSRKPSTKFTSGVPAPAPFSMETASSSRSIRTTRFLMSFSELTVLFARVGLQSFAVFDDLRLI